MMQIRSVSRGDLSRQGRKARSTSLPSSTASATSQSAQAPQHVFGDTSRRRHEREGPRAVEDIPPIKGSEKKAREAGGADAGRYSPGPALVRAQ